MGNLNHTFSALGDQTRRAILSRLMSGEVSLSDLAEPFDMTQTAVTKHVNILSEAGLLVVEKRGRTRHCRLDASVLKEASEWLQDYQTFWEHQFGNLTDFLTDERKQ